MTAEELDHPIEAVARRWPEDEYAFTFLHPVPNVVDWIYTIALQTPLDVVLRTVRAQSLLDHRDVLAGLSIPVLAIYPRRDPYYPSDLVHFIAETAPHGRALILEESAHFPFSRPTLRDSTRQRRLRRQRPMITWETVDHPSVLRQVPHDSVVASRGCRADIHRPRPGTGCFACPAEKAARR
jgi:pimeloyl-ACP methyl ester carboxylesterase